MAVDAIIQNGSVVESASESSLKKAAAENNGMDKDAFLQLLVAQMKYQDPLEPTSNTEYISQYATFSQVEQMQNMASTMELSRASAMVGQLVNIETTDTNGEAKTTQGVVEYVTYESNKAYVSVDGTLYSADDVIAVVNPAYQTAYDLAVAFATTMNQLPALGNVTLADSESITTLQEGFNEMTAYQQSFIANAYIEELENYVARIAELKAAAEGTTESGESAGTESTEGTEDTESTEGTGESSEAGTEV